MITQKDQNSILAGWPTQAVLHDSASRFGTRPRAGQGQLAGSARGLVAAAEPHGRDTSPAADTTKATEGAMSEAASISDRPRCTS